MEKRLEKGMPAPDFELRDANGRTWRFADLKGKRVILYFYPKDDTPGCTAQACDFRDTYDSLTQAGYVVMGVSPQGADSHRAFTNKYSLNFPLLIDEDHAVADSYGAWGEKSNYGKTSMGIIRSTFVIDENGIVEEARYGVKAQGHVARLKQDLGLA